MSDASAAALCGNMIKYFAKREKSGDLIEPMEAARTLMREAGKLELDFDYPDMDADKALMALGLARESDDEDGGMQYKKGKSWVDG